MTLRCLFFIVIIIAPRISAAQDLILQKKYTTTIPATSSVLANGKWFKMKVYHDGVYRLTYEDIKNMGFSNPGGIRIFGNGGTMLPFMNGTPRYDDLIENAVYIYKGSDEIFNQGDFILFFCRGPVTWTYNPVTALFEHQMHPYSNASCYFITDAAGEGRLINTQPPVTGEPSVQITTFDHYDYHERNKYNFLESGRQWFGERFDYAAYDTTFLCNGLVTSSPVKLKVNLVSRSGNTKTFVIYGNDNVLASMNIAPVVLENKTSIYANQKSGIYSFSVTNDPINIKLTYNKYISTDEGFLDYITINARRNLSLINDAMLFRDQTYAGSGMIATYSVENCSQQTEIWDVTDPFNISKMPAQLAGSTLTFSDSTNVLKEYLAVNPEASFPKPDIIPREDIGIISNQNLHGEPPQQMLIVTHPLFREAADSIAAFHRIKDNLSVCVATPDQIYNEFSSGAPDVSAIRDFARLLYRRSTGDHNRLKYILLVGDGSFNNLSRVSGNSNYILTYQSENSLNASESYVSDDFFGFMEETEGGSEVMENYSLDLGVGRLPVKNADEAMAMYDKIKNYNTYENMGDWRNNILFAADDEDANLHMKQADDLADWVEATYPQFAVKKVLIDAYPQVSTSTGSRYPDANRIICDNIEKGLLIFNYTGHGGEMGLASEQILLNDDLENLTNKNNLPLFVTATCEFSRFDDLATDDEGTISESTSAGERSLVNPNGGSIALLSTTRIAYSNDNYHLNTRFLQIVFTRDENDNYYKLGDIVKTTKNVTGSNRNKLNFILLGDPALALAIPKYSIVTDSLNQRSVFEPLDTLKAFSHIRISGHLEDTDQNILTSYNGIIYPSVFDKKETVTTLANDNDAEPMQFTTREDLLYKGKASVVNGRFSFEFMVPKDITYSFGNGKITYYSENPAYDANGQFSAFLIGGTNQTVQPDNDGPDISIFMNDAYFNDQGITNQNPVIYAEISDESGINTIGNGIGHDITGVIDGDVAHPVILNEYFEANLDDYTSGFLRYPMENLEEGWHSLKVKVWDIYNNSGEKTLEFSVISGNRIIIANAGNFPNPASDYTSFTFEHNKPGEELTITISVFDMGGRLIAAFSENILTSGFNSTPRYWELTDQNGNKLKQGIYPYRIRVSDSNGAYTDTYQKLVVIRQ